MFLKRSKKSQNKTETPSTKTTTGVVVSITRDSEVANKSLVCMSCRLRSGFKKMNEV